MSGVLKLTLREAIFERDAASFFNMDPSYQINWKDEVIHGENAFGGGKTPKWNKKHELNVGIDLDCMGVMMVAFKDGSDVICQTNL